MSDAKTEKRHGERRKFSRFDFIAPARIVVNDRGWEVQLIDVSLKGALLQRPSDYHHHTHTMASVIIRLEDDSQIRMEGVVVHQTEERLGLRCDSIDIGSFSRLKRLVAWNLGEEKLLHRELDALGNPPSADADSDA